MTRWHPWRQLRRLPQIDLCWADLPEGIRGCVRDDTIYLDRRLRQDERRCTLTHELVHHALGHADGCRHADEALVRQITARLLIPLDDLIRAATWTTSVGELADDLWVSPDVVMTRLEHLHPAEIGALRAATAHHRSNA